MVALAMHEAGNPNCIERFSSEPSAHVPLNNKSSGYSSYSDGWMQNDEKVRPVGQDKAVLAVLAMLSQHCTLATL
jgi:hypothetical protein